jgi:threonine dehydrogenase-like Zn-dependent dehydrogenase
MSVVGNLLADVDLPLQTLVTRELSLYGCCASCGEYPDCLDLLANGAVDGERTISAVAPLSEGAEWFRRLRDKEPGLLKVVLRP